MAEWWEKSTRGSTRLARWWDYSAPFRRRFGLPDGWRLARDFARIEFIDERGPARSIRVPGWADPVWLRPASSDLWVFRQLVLGQELDLPITPPRRILDGGANVGLATRWFAARWPGAEIAAVELEPTNVDVLRRNAESVPRAVICHGALWGESGTVGIDAADHGEAGFRVAAGQAAREVPAWSVGDLLDLLAWDVVDLVKLDIEGAERQVLSDAERWLHRAGSVMVELHERFAPGCEAAFATAFPPSAWTIARHGEYLLATRRPER